MNFKSQKYGEIAGWKPDRCEFKLQITVFLLSLSKMIKYANLSKWLLIGRMTMSSSQPRCLSPMYTPAGANPTKAVPDLIKTSTILAPLLSSPYIDKYSQPAYVLLQNGLNVEVDLYHAIKALGKDEPKIVGTSLYIGTNLLAPDLVDHNSFVGIVSLSLRSRFTSQLLGSTNPWNV